MALVNVFQVGSHWYQLNGKVWFNFLDLLLASTINTSVSSGASSAFQPLHSFLIFSGFSNY